MNTKLFDDKNIFLAVELNPVTDYAKAFDKVCYKNCWNHDIFGKDIGII